MKATSRLFRFEDRLFDPRVTGQPATANMRVMAGGVFLSEGMMSFVFAKQGVLVAAAEAAMRERALRGDCQDLRMVIQQAGGEYRHVARAGGMVRGGDAGHAGEPRAAQAKLARVPVHAAQERRL